MPPGRPRAGGVLLHPTSLPGPGPVGELGPYAHAFLEWMSLAGLSIWQVLPLHPVGPGASPYASPSAFAGDPRLISVERLVADGLLEPVALPWGQDQVDVDLVEGWKLPLVRRAGVRIAASAECRAWVREQPWLGEWAGYAARAQAQGSSEWWTWPEAEPDPVAVRTEEGVQYLFHLHWSALREAAAARGIRIVGDLPIFVAHDACDVWAHRDLFLFRDGRPDPVAGVPPDYFSPLGQRWGNPMYDWKRHQKTRFAWWRARLRRELQLVDMVRLDHFRGFAAAWAIPADEPDARRGEWTPGPDRALFDAVKAEIGELPLWAEDLGVITPDVEALRSGLGLPGMKVLQFAFGGDADHPFLPHNHRGEDWVVYTGTHDNDTAVGWYQSTDPRSQHRFRVYTGRDGSAPAWAMLREAWASVAHTAVAPMQDVLGLGAEARMNTPGIAKGNWGWRLRDLPWHLGAMMRGLGETFGRTPAADE